VTTNLSKSDQKTKRILILQQEKVHQKKKPYTPDRDGLDDKERTTERGETNQSTWQKMKGSFGKFFHKNKGIDDLEERDDLE